MGAAETIDVDTFSSSRARQMLAMLGPQATGVEGYLALVGNGDLAALILAGLYRAQPGADPRTVVTSNPRPLFCRRQNRLRSEPGEISWRLSAEDDQGRAAVEALIT